MSLRHSQGPPTTALKPQEPWTKIFDTQDQQANHPHPPGLIQKVDPPLGFYNLHHRGIRIQVLGVLLFGSSWEYGWGSLQDPWFCPTDYGLEMIVYEAKTSLVEIR